MLKELKVTDLKKLMVKKICLTRFLFGPRKRPYRVDWDERDG